MSLPAASRLPASRLPARALWLAGALLAMLAIRPMFSAPIGPTMWRETQTAMLTEHFADAGFAIDHMTLDIVGRAHPRMVYEFPIYNVIVGTLYLLFGHSVFWGKVISLAAGIAALRVFHQLVQRWYGSTIAHLTTATLAITPVSITMFTTIQPDTLVLLFVLVGVERFDRWTASRALRDLAAASVWLLAAGLGKYPLLVPYVPYLCVAGLISGRRFRVPAWREVAMVTLVVLVPMAAWYVYRRALTDPMFDRPSYYAMFFLGDLRRFLQPSFYLKPLFTLGFLCVPAGAWLCIAAAYRRLGWREVSLLVGIALYFVLVPTVSDQWYYLLACSPILALCAGVGAAAVVEQREARGRGMLPLWSLGAAVLVTAIIGGVYATRRDRVMASAAQLAASVSKPDDLLFVANMHDRGIGVGGFDPALFYLAKRRGWNVSYLPGTTPEDVRRQASLAALRGARWMVVTWYDPSLEPWFARVLPRRLRRDPGVNSDAVRAAVNACYPIAATSRNVAVYSLDQRYSAGYHCGGR